MTPNIVSVPGQPQLAPLGAYDLAAFGYTVQEIFVSGTASSFKSLEPLKSDGHWSVTQKDIAAYTTRIVMAKPMPAKFNGTVVVEWLNVTAGMDTPVDWWTAHRELLRGGYVGELSQWVSRNLQST